MALHPNPSDAVYRQNNCTTQGTPMSIAQYATDGLFAPVRIASVLHTTCDEVARTAGLGLDA